VRVTAGSIGVQVRRSWIGSVAVLATVALIAAMSADALAEAPATLASEMLSPPATDPGVGGPALAVLGDRVVASSVGPVLWASADGGQTFGGAQSPNATRCTVLPAGDDDVAVGADGTLYAVQNCLAVGGTVFIWRSLDGGRSWAPPAGGRLQAIAAGMEAGMITADPADPRTLYVIGEALDLTTIAVWKSTDGGRSFAVRGIVNLPLSADLLASDGPSAPTRLLVDPTNPRRLCLMWWAISKREIAQLLGIDGVTDYEYATHAFAATSNDAGATWAAREIINTGSPPLSLIPPGHAEYDDLANWYPAAAIDSAGTIYFVVAEQRRHAPGAHIMLMSSRDGGATWSQRQQVDADANATFAPAITAGAPGRIGIAFLHADRPDPLDPGAQWSERYAFSGDADTPHPQFVHAPVTGRVLTAAVCPLTGGPHGCRSRTLSIGHDANGRALILGVNGAGPTSTLVISRQVAGAALLGASVPATKPRLRLRVRPQRARANRRVVFRFRVTSVQGARRNGVAGAHIRFAGRVARTDRRGKAAIRATLHTSGRRHARATKRGFRAASATIHVRP
jgi:hypothetical protein